MHLRLPPRSSAGLPPVRFGYTLGTLTYAVPRIVVPHAELALVCRTWQVRRLSLFGSVLRDDFRDDSDVDVLVEFEVGSGASLFTLVSLRDALSGLLGGRHIDIVTPGALHPLLRDKILASAVTEFAA